MNDPLSNIFYTLNKVNPDNKLAVFWFNLKQRMKYIIPYNLRQYYRVKVRTIFKPQHSRIRKVVPRYWMDLDYVLIAVNFEIIKSFYEEEYKDGPVDWNSDKVHKEFAKWLEEAYKYITIDRPALEQKIENAYPDSANYPSGKTTYSKLYGKVDKLEKELKDRDTEVMTELIKRREGLWT